MDANDREARRERVALLLEEMGEALQVIGKIQRHGWASTHPDGGPTNRDALGREVGDVLAAVALACEAGDLNPEHLFLAKVQKLQKLPKYLHHGQNADLCRNHLVKLAAD